jgi:4-diphosphocytidyl-2-C-methyl-D-erythritol kinase
LAEVPPPHDNLVLQASALLREAIDPSLPVLHFRLKKRIPSAAGLGGGSSDAAAAIDLALQAWGVRLHPAQRLEAALRLGADVPFFAAGHAASVVEGIGEHLVPLPAPEPPAGLLLITPTQRLSTAAVFAELDRSPLRLPGAPERVDEVADLLREKVDGMTLAASTGMLRDANDLWAPATRLSTGLAAARAAAVRVIGRAVLLTGSGPTLVAVYPSEAAATRAAITLQTEAPVELDGAAIITTSTMGRGADS